MDLINYERLAARGLDISRDTLRRHCKEGKFPQPIQLGRRIFWKINEIEKFLNSPAVTAAAHARFPRRRR